MLSNFDFDVISRSWGYLFREGLTFTLMLTGLAAGIGMSARHPFVRTS